MRYFLALDGVFFSPAIPPTREIWWQPAAGAFKDGRPDARSGVIMWPVVDGSPDRTPFSGTDPRRAHRHAGDRPDTVAPPGRAYKFPDAEPLFCDTCASSLSGTDRWLLPRACRARRSAAGGSVITLGMR